MFGIGGGVVTTPALFAIFKMLGYEDGPSLKTAIGTSIAGLTRGAVPRLAKRRNIRGRAQRRTKRT